MVAETVLLAVLPPLLLLLGIAAGAALATYGRLWLKRLCGRSGSYSNDASDPEAAAADVPAAKRPVAVKTCAAAEEQPLQTIHVVASAPSLLPSGWDPTSRRSSFVFTSGAATPLHGALASRLGAAAGGTDSPLAVRASPFSQPLLHRRTPSREVGLLARAGGSALGHVMEEWDTRSALVRLVSDGLNAPPSPAHGGGSGLFSPTPSTLFSPAPSLAPMPSGEVHMDEIDLIEQIGRGGFG